MTTDPDAYTKRVDNHPQRNLQAPLGERGNSGRSPGLPIVPAKTGCGNTVSRHYLVCSCAQEIQDRIRMLCAKVRKHSLERAVVADVALAQEADKAYPRHDLHRASAFL